jgi:poly [ADP-ribose] polymerase
MFYQDTEKLPHPIDVNYDLLKCQLTLLDKNSNEFKIIETYTQNTNQNAWRKCEIMDVWKVERADEV